MKPIQNITVETLDGNSKTLEALVDSGSFYTIIRSDALPVTTSMYYYREPKLFGTAAQEGKLKILGVITLIIEINNQRIDDSVLISDHLSSDMIIGAKTMQAWDISIVNDNGNTKIKVGRDMRDPVITTVCDINAITKSL